MITENELTSKALFQGKEIRRVLVDGEWWFSVIDVITLLTDSENSSDYWYWMKTKKDDSDVIELSRISRRFKLTSSDGKKRETDCANTEGILRIIQSIPSPKAEPFKRWLAKLGRERIEEIENPELGIKRARELYAKKGYPEEWIEKRVQGISIRQKLTDEWDDRGAQTNLDFALLSDEIMKGSFGLKTNQYKEHKGLKRENLRDHMTDLELVITMLGEVSTTQLTQERDSQGMHSLQRDAKEGGAVAGSARRDLEQRTGKRVVTKDNFLQNSTNLISAKRKRKVKEG